MSEKVNKATTKGQKLFQGNKSRIADFCTQSIKEKAKAIDIRLNLHGCTNTMDKIK